MPKEAKSARQWRLDLEEFARRGCRWAPGRAPPKNSPWNDVARRIVDCVNAGGQRANPWDRGGQQRQCVCGGYCPKTKLKAPPRPATIVAGAARLLPIPHTMPRLRETRLSVDEIRRHEGRVIRKDGFVDLHVFAPISGKCPTCGSDKISMRRSARLKMVYQLASWPIHVPGS
jgi:hypothetical protein